MEISTFNTFAEAFLALSSDQVDAVVSGDNTAIFHEEEEGFEMVFSGLYGRPAALAFETPELAVAAAKVMQEMYDEGWFKEVDDKIWRYRYRPMGKMGRDNEGLEIDHLLNNILCWGQNTCPRQFKQLRNLTVVFYNR